MYYFFSCPATLSENMMYASLMIEILTILADFSDNKIKCNFYGADLHMEVNVPPSSMTE